MLTLRAHFERIRYVLHPSDGNPLELLGLKRVLDLGKPLHDCGSPALGLIQGDALSLELCALSVFRLDVGQSCHDSARLEIAYQNELFLLGFSGIPGDGSSAVLFTRISSNRLIVSTTEERGDIGRLDRVGSTGPAHVGWYHFPFSCEVPLEKT